MDALMTVALVGAAAANSAAPGPCILVASSRAAMNGLQSGLQVTLGIAASKVFLLVVSWTMIMGIVSLTGEAREALRIAGLAVLVMLAMTMITVQSSARAPVIGRLRLGDASLGLALGLSSPLNLLFMFALLPQFVDVERLDAASIAIASAAVLLGGALPIAAACVFSARVLKTSPQMVRLINRLCGVALLGFAGLAAVAGP